MLLNPNLHLSALTLCVTSGNNPELNSQRFNCHDLSLQFNNKTLCFGFFSFLCHKLTNCETADGINNSAIKSVRF